MLNAYCNSFFGKPLLGLSSRCQAWRVDLGIRRVDLSNT